MDKIHHTDSANNSHSQKFLNTDNINTEDFNSTNLKMGVEKEDKLMNSLKKALNIQAEGNVLC